MIPPTTDVFELVTARAAHGRPWEVLVAWRAPTQGDRLVQLYVDQRLAAVTTHPDDREATLLIDPSHRRTIEPLAVDADSAGLEMPHALASWHRGERHAMTAEVMRDERFAPDAALRRSVDGEEPQTAPLWDHGVARSGFGGLFGLGGFGFDDAAGPGLGRGELGRGPLGSDGDALRIRHDALAAGEHTLTLEGIDAAGRPLAPPLTQTHTVTRPPAPPAALRVENGRLHWHQETLSP